VRLSLRKGAWSVSTPQASAGNRGNGAPSICVGERRTAGPSASLGMTNWRAALTSAAVTEGWTERPTCGGRVGRGMTSLPHRQRRLGAPLPRFPAEACGVDTLHAPFLNERRTRGPLQHSVAGNRGQARFWLEWDTTALAATLFRFRSEAYESAVLW
jgi:hypothetical protein